MVFAVLPTILPLILSASEEEPSLTCGPTFNGMNGDRPELMTLPFKAVGDFPNARGYVNATLMGGHHFFWTYHFNQIDPKCENGAGSADKSCGLIIHEGTDCKAPGPPLPMDGGCGYWMADWENSFYTSTPCTSESCEPAFINGYPRGNSFSKNENKENFQIDDYVGRVFMAYDYEGHPMMCSTLQPAVPAAKGGSYVAGHAEGWGEEGSKFGISAVKGVVGPLTMVNEEGKAEGLLSWQLEGLDRRCNGGASTYHHRECSIEVVEETTCKTGAGNSCKDANGDRGPCPEPTAMASVHYTASRLGSSSPKGNYEYIGLAIPLDASVDGGIDHAFEAAVAGMLNRAVIVYDSEGERVACALLYNGVCPPGCKPNLENPVYGRRKLSGDKAKRELLFSSTPPEDHCIAGCTAA